MTEYDASKPISGSIPLTNVSTPEQRAALARFDYAIKRAKEGPNGTWAQRWVPFVCKHDVVRCTHGDEIIQRNWRRCVCLVCGRALRGDIPDVCFFTCQLHPSVVAKGA